MHIVVDVIKIVYIATLVLLVLGGLGIIGTQLAHATTTNIPTSLPTQHTNEGSYQTGLWFGYYNYKCINNDDPCDGPFPSQISNECAVGSGTVVNSTACYDRYYEGFVTWCGHNPKDCVMEFKTGNTPTPGIIKKTSNLIN